MAYKSLVSHGENTSKSLGGQKKKIQVLLCHHKKETLVIGSYHSKEHLFL